MASKQVNVKLGADITQFQGAMRRAQRTFKKSAANLKRIGKSMTLSLTAPLTAFAGASVLAFDKQAKAEAKLRTALKGNEKAFRGLTAQAKELQKVTLFGDEETMAAQSMLASMGLEEEAIQRLIPLVQDMATAKGMNLTAAADLVAKSVGSSTNALSRYGIQIEGEVGSTERLNSAVEALTGQFEGQSKAAAKAGAGGLKQLQNRFGDLMEDIGKMLIPVLNHLLDAVNFVIDAWNNLDGGLKIVIITIGGIIAAIGPAVALFGTLVSVVGFLLSPMGAIVVVLSSLAAAVIYVVDNFKVFGEIGKMVAVSLGNAFLNIGQMLITPFELAIDGVNKVLSLLGKEEFKNPFTSMKDGLESLKGEVPKVTSEFGSFGDAVSNAANTAKEALFGVGTAIGVGGDTGSAVTGGEVASVDTGGSDGGSLLSGLSAMESKLISLSVASKEFSVSLAEDFASGMAAAVASGQNFFVSMSQIFGDLLKKIGRLVIKAALLAAIFKMIPGLGAVTAGPTDFIGLLTGGLQGRASGGPVVGGRPYIVGENGPELFSSNVSGHITPNHALGSTTIIPEVRISGSDLMLVFDRENQRKKGINS